MPTQSDIAHLLNATHDPALRSWVTTANDVQAAFPLQNLPLGRFRRVGSEEPLRMGVAIGDQVLDLQRAAACMGWPAGVLPMLQPLAQGDLLAFMALGRPAWRALRAALSAALRAGSAQQVQLSPCLVPQAQAQMAMPCEVGDYTDFFAGIHHARSVGSLFRPDSPLMPNYQWVPIGYHGRASSVGIQSQVVRPNGQVKTSADVPLFGPSQRLDYELELGLWVGQGNAQGNPVSITQAEDHLFGVTPLNDWSARDIQAWEYQPLGPFLAKSFATTVSPWIVSFEALAPFRRPFTRPAGDPQPLPYLDSDFNRSVGAIDMTLEVWLQTAAMQSAGQAAVRLSQSNFLDAYWTAAQLLTHHTSNGCNLRPGDLLGTGTLSGPLPVQGGSLLELSQGGKVPLGLPNGDTRSFLQDGDTVTLRAFCEAPGARRISLGDCTATVWPAPLR